MPRSGYLFTLHYYFFTIKKDLAEARSFFYYAAGSMYTFMVSPAPKNLR